MSLLRWASRRGGVDQRDAGVVFAGGDMSWTFIFPSWIPDDITPVDITRFAHAATANCAAQWQFEASLI